MLTDVFSKWSLVCLFVCLFVGLVSVRLCQDQESSCSVLHDQRCGVFPHWRAVCQEGEYNKTQTQGLLWTLTNGLIILLFPLSLWQPKEQWIRKLWNLPHSLKIYYSKLGSLNLKFIVPPKAQTWGLQTKIVSHAKSIQYNTLEHERNFTLYLYFKLYLIWLFIFNL